MTARPTVKELIRCVLDLQSNKRDIVEDFRSFILQDIEKRKAAGERLFLPSEEEMLQKESVHSPFVRVLFEKYCEASPGCAHPYAELRAFALHAQRPMNYAKTFSLRLIRIEDEPMITNRLGLLFQVDDWTAYKKWAKRRLSCLVDLAVTEPFNPSKHIHDTPERLPFLKAVGYITPCVLERGRKKQRNAA